jgi:hypothetical protein
MKIASRFVAALLAAFALSLFALGASAQDARSSANEPSLAQIYQAANSGNLDRADSMIDQVLKSHPNSAKAHYVKAELAAREGKADVARQHLAAAEKIAPGLPFVKAESVQALRNQLSSTSNSAATTNNRTAPARQMGAPPAYNAPAPARGFPWRTLIVVAAIVLIGVAVLRRRNAAMAAAAANNGYGGAYGNTSAAPYGQTGYGPVYPPGAAGGAYPPGTYPPGAYPPGAGYPQQPSMGSSIARGVGTGLAVGAGVVAAEELGRRMFGHGDAHAGAYNPNTSNVNTPSLDQIDDGMRRNLNSDMGGADFGINDGGGWDDGGGADMGGGGGDWDT